MHASNTAEDGRQEKPPNSSYRKNSNKQASRVSNKPKAQNTRVTMRPQGLGGDPKPTKPKPWRRIEPRSRRSKSCEIKGPAAKEAHRDHSGTGVPTARPQGPYQTGETRLRGGQPVRPKSPSKKPASSQRETLTAGMQSPQRPSRDRRRTHQRVPATQQIRDP